VTPAYRKSLLYHVSNAFERPDKADFKSQGKREDIRSGEPFAPKPILGMQKYSQATENTPRLTIRYAAGNSLITRSTTHGGFDNDPFTMNDILKLRQRHQVIVPDLWCEAGERRRGDGAWCFVR
jgi:hypothetical protein